MFWRIRRRPSAPMSPALLVIVALLNAHDLAGQDLEALRRAVDGKNEVRVRRHSYGIWFSVRMPAVEDGHLLGTIQTGEVAGTPTIDSVRLALSDLQEIKVQSGTRVVVGLGSGAAAGLLVVGAIQYACDADPPCQEPFQPSDYALGIVSFAAAFGVLGALTPAWKTVYVQGIPAVEVRSTPLVMTMIPGPDGRFGLGASITF